jgi:hypothetical protein
MFLRLLFAWFVRAVVCKTDFKAGLKLKDSIETRYDNLSHLYSKAVTLSGL